MAIDVHGFEFLTACARHGIEFDRTLMLGRQNTYGLDSKQVESANWDFGGFDGLEHGSFAEPLFEALGATEVDAADASGFEGATHVVDLNGTVPDELKRKYSAVFDGGTIEHVFNAPTALANAMSLVAPGGHLLLVTPTNATSGHGFYQFSPELFWRALTPANGFEVRFMLMRDRSARRWHELKDPDQLGRRVTFTTRGTTYLYVAAQRVNDSTAFGVAPQQSDYVRDWAKAPRASGQLTKLNRLKTWVATTRNSTFGTYRFDRRAFSPIDINDWQHAPEHERADQPAG